jgi:cytochrome oxidase assembly protein ShyY1
VSEGPKLRRGRTRNVRASCLLLTVVAANTIANFALGPHTRTWQLRRLRSTMA